MLYYAKISVNSDANAIRSLFLALGATEESIILDTSHAPKQENSVLQQLKQSLLATGEHLTIDSLRSLGKNSREISKELQWFISNHKSLSVLDIPSTLNDTAIPLQLLSEVYLLLAASEIHNVKTTQQAGIQAARAANRPLGRAKIPYPENWETAYQQWKHKNISITEFMALTGLKRGTLYNLIKQYKDVESIQKEA